MKEEGKDKTMTTKHYLNDDGTRWYIKINNISDELNILYEEKQVVPHGHQRFPYYVVFDEDVGVEEKYSTLKELKEVEEK